MKRNILLASFVLLNIVVSSQSNENVRSKSNNELETKRGRFQ